MHINDLCDDMILLIFANFDLRTRRYAGETCRRWASLSRKSWRRLHNISLYTLFEQPKLPKGKHLNKALHWVLRRCGKNLRILNMADPEPEFRFVKANGVLPCTDYETIFYRAFFQNAHFASSDDTVQIWKKSISPACFY